jgi:hypothetical protein
MVNWLVEVLIDNKSQDDHRFKGKQHSSIDTHTRVMILVSKPVLGVKKMKMIK